MQASIYLAFFLVASVAAASVQPENVPAPVVGNSPVVPSQPVAEGPQQAPGVVGPVDHQHQPHGPSYYSPSGLITVVGGNAEQGNLQKPGQFVRNYEQYGQPESASIPPNYKPFGSWGLYIGGNPADGYYTNYYKALGNSVDKQQVGEPAKPVVSAGPVPSQAAAFSPFLRQASSSPFAGGDYYPFAYSPADLSAASRSSVEPAVHSAIHSPGDSSYLAYADMYATKKIGQSAYAQKEATKEVQVPQVVPQQPQSAKGYAPQHQQYRYVYPSGVAHSPAYPLLSAPSVVPQHHVVAYPVPVGSQIVGSQPGVEGSFSPYGIHAFTKYAVKPTVVSHEPSYYYSSPYPQSPVYKQQQHAPSQYSSYSSFGSSSYQPLSYYGFPVSQIQPQPHQHGAPIVPLPQVGGPIEGSPVVHHSVSQPQGEPVVPLDKAEDKPAVVTPQKA